MAENGTPIPNGDVEMQESGAQEDPSLAPTTASADPTDPQPPPQTQPDTSTIAPEHLSTIRPHAPTSNAPTPSARPASMPPMKAVAHGGPTRQYLNQNVTPHLLEAMKYLAAYEPEKPLLWLSEFLRDRSREVEGA